MNNANFHLENVGAIKHKSPKMSPASVQETSQFQFKDTSQL